MSVVLRLRRLVPAFSALSLLLAHTTASAVVLVYADADGIANWSSGEQAWTNTGTPSVWISTSSAELSNGNAANQLTLTEAINATSIAQSGAGTKTTISGSGQTLTLSGGGANPVVANSSGADLTFASGLTIQQNPATSGAAQRWNAASGSNIIVNATLSGALTGGLIKEGAGVLQLNGVNNYSGATYISAGVLQVGNASSLGTSTLTFQGGALRYGAAITGGLSTQFAALSGSAAILDTNGFTITLGSAITGSGGLVKQGSGILVTAAGSTYTGGTTVEAGILRSGVGTGTGTNPFGASGSMVTVKNGATLDLNWSAATNYTSTYQLTIEGKGVADTSGTVFGGYIGALTSSGSYNNTTASFTSMLLTGDTTISGQMGGTSGQRYGVPANIDARVRDSGGTVIPNQYYTLTIVNGNALSWRGAAANNVYVGDIRLEQGRLWSDADNFGDNNFSIYINANLVGATTVWGELGNWLGTRTIAKKTVMTGGLVALEGYQGSSAGKIDYGTVSTFTLSGQMTLNVSPLLDNRISSTYSVRDGKVSGQITGAGGFRYTGSTAVLTDWDPTYTTSAAINRYSVLYLTNSTNNFTGTIKLDSGVIRMSDGTANGALGGGGNEFSFSTTTAPAILDLFGTNQSIGALNGASSTFHFVQNNRQNTTSTLTVGSGGASGSFAGVLRDYTALPADNVAITNEGATNAKLALVKTGAGQQVLTNVSTYTGGTTVNGGSLQIGTGATGQSTARLGSGTFTVNNGGRLEGNGFIGFTGLTSNVAAGGTLSVGTSTQTALQYLTVGGTLNVAGTLSFDLWGVTNGSGSLANSDFLTFLTGSGFSLSSTGVLNITAKAGAGDSTTWAAGTWFQLFDFTNATLGHSVALDNTSNWLLPALNTGLVEYDFSRLATEGRIYVVAKTSAPTLEFDPADTYTGTAQWKDDAGYMAWDDASVTGVALQEWTNGASALFKNSASNSLSVVENVSASSIFQSATGTITSIDSSNGSVLSLTGTNRVVSNTSGAALTFGSGLKVDITGTEKEWYADTTSPIVVNGIISGAAGSYVSGTVTGGLIKSGAGVLELRGVNTYSGVTRLQAGTVLAVDAAAFGTSKVVFEGGTLRYGAAVTGGYASLFAPLNYGAMARLDTNGFNVTLDTALSGSSGLTKLGTGILTVAAGSSYTGGTVVEAGILKSGATAVNAANAFGANGSQITVKNGATLDVNWADASNYAGSAKYNLTVEGKGVADTSGTVAGGFVGAVVSSGALSATASPFNLITMTGDTTFAGRYQSATGRWGITAINANGFNITIVNANGLSWAVGSSANAQNVRDIYIEQAHVYADGTFFGDDNYSIIINASKPGATLFRGELRRYSSSGTITKKITINGGIVQYEGEPVGGLVPRTLTLAGQVTLMDNNVIAANRFNSSGVSRDIKITGKLTGAGGFEYQGSTGSYSYNGGANVDRYSVLTLTNSANDFTGAVNLIRGVIRMSDGVASGTLGAGSNAVNFTTPANISVLDLFGTNQSIGALNGTSATNHFVQNNRASTTATLTVGNGGANGNFAGVLRDYGALPAGNASMNESTYTGDGATGAKLALVKTGAGTQVLTGVSTFSGGTTVNGGVLQVGSGNTGQSTATLGSGGFTVSSGGTLAGNGIVGVAGTLNVVSSGGILSAGISTQTAAQRLDIYGGLTSTGTLSFDLWSVTLGSGNTANSDFLRFFSNEQITLGGKLTVTNSTGTLSTTWTQGTWFQIVDWNAVTAGNRSVNFTDLSLLPTLGSGLQWDLSQFATDGRIYVAVPEPGRAALLLVGMMLCAVHRRRRA